ncbi:MAG: hypothetical protein GXO87_06095, partial [Chlorobi bacterium]|nr:hypothetical protein [Chlorobiota bacterium]
PETSDIPVIFMTSLDSTVDKIKGFEIGAVDYVTKPFEPLELLKRVETHLKITMLQNELKDYNLLLERKVEERTAELRESNKKLNIAKTKAEAADKMKGEFLAQISHEIRTPLNSIISLSSLVVEEFQDKVDEDFMDIIEGIRNGINRITRTVELILNYSEIISQGYKLNPSTINLNEIVKKYVHSFGKLSDAKGLNMNLIENERITLEQIDPFSVDIILKNIIENAVAFTIEGRIDITLKTENGKKIFECKDTGVGISPEYLPKIFEPFSQEEQGYTRKTDGNGLGLPLAKKHCELNKIELEIETEKGKGSTFRLVFP